MVTIVNYSNGRHLLNTYNVLEPVLKFSNSVSLSLSPCPKLKEGYQT